MAVRHTRIDSTLGELTLSAEADALTGLYFTQHRYPPSTTTLGAYVNAQDDALFTYAHRQISAYLARERRSFDVAYHLSGNAFQQEVWALLLDIPYGQTTTYGALAIRLGARSWAQSVGQAVGHNPLSLIIPCHRVLGADGRLTGYAGGLRRKRMLLDIEESAATREARLF